MSVGSNPKCTQKKKKKRLLPKLRKVTESISKLNNLLYIKISLAKL